MIFENFINLNKRKSLYVTPQRKELLLCISDLIMDNECTHGTIEKIIKLVYKESKKLKRHDVIENLTLHCLIS